LPLAFHAKESRSRATRILCDAFNDIDRRKVMQHWSDIPISTLTSALFLTAGRRRAVMAEAETIVLAGVRRLTSMATLRLGRRGGAGGWRHDAPAAAAEAGW
jgi:hypothetical protein